MEKYNVGNVPVVNLVGDSCYPKKAFQVGVKIAHSSVEKRGSRVSHPRDQ